MLQTMPEAAARSYRFPGGYEAAQRSRLNTGSASLRVSGDLRMNAPPESFYVIETSQATVTTVVAGPLAAREPADLLASLYNAEWRYCDQPGGAGARDLPRRADATTGLMYFVAFSGSREAVRIALAAAASWSRFRR
jgi:hypothetical protein